MTGNQASPSITPSPSPSSTPAVAKVVDEVRRIRVSDALGRITVIAPSFGAARDLVRAMALSGGAVGVTVRTASQLVTELAGPALAPRAPLPFPLLAAAVEKSLDATPGKLEPVAAESITAQAVAQACLRLGAVEAGSVTAETPLHTEVLRLSAQAHAATGPAYYPQVEAIAVALERLDQLGHLILAAPLRGTETERRLRVALDARGISALPGTDGRDLASASDPGGAGVVTGTHVVHASDADDEVRAVVRFVRSRLIAGVPGHQIGVYFPSSDPYLRLLVRAFSEADITVNGPSTSSLGRTAAGRSLVRLLHLDRVEMPRAALLSVVAEGAMTVDDDEGRSVSSRRLEKLTRTRVPVLGGADWEHLAAAAEDPDPLPSGTIPPDAALSDPDRAAARALCRLVEQVREHLGAVDGSQTWSQVADSLASLVNALFRPGPERTAVLAVIGSLGDLDLVAPALPRDRVVGAVATRLDSIADRVGDEGVGVTLGPIDDAVGRTLDTVCVVGMAEGLLPVLHRPEPLLPEGAVEPPAGELLDERYRVLQMALASGNTHRLCSFPRGSMRGGGDRIPSRWLLPTLAALTGATVHATRWQADVENCSQITAIRSFVEGVLIPPESLGSDPATAAELRIRALAASAWTVSTETSPGHDPQHDPSASDLLHPDLLSRAHEMRRDRRLGIFSRFTGDVSAAREHLDVLDTPVSPTRLEDWAQSPYLFFLTSVLRVRTLDEPAAEIEMDLRDYGNLVHTILEKYVATRIATGQGPDLELLERVVQEECDAAMAAAPGLVESLWRRRADLLATELRQWFTMDLDDADAGWQPDATELEFGRPQAPVGDNTAEPLVREVPFEVATSTGTRTIRLAGSIDRLDVRDGVQRVTDYKTGKPPGKDDRPSAEDPTLAGARFQLPLYAAAADVLRDQTVSTVRYWYCTERGDFELLSLDVTEGLMDKVRTDVGNLVDAIEKGWFPLKGGRGSARDLADLLGGAELDRTWKLLSTRQPLVSHPAFAGIRADEQSESGTEHDA